MATIKLTNAAQAQVQPTELRDTLVPGFLCKITPAGRKVFMLQYRTNAGERRKSASTLSASRACTLFLRAVRHTGTAVARPTV